MRVWERLPREAASSQRRQVKATVTELWAANIWRPCAALRNEATRHVGGGSRGTMYRGGLAAQPAPLLAAESEMMSHLDSWSTTSAWCLGCSPCRGLCRTRSPPSGSSQGSTVNLHDQPVNDGDEGVQEGGEGAPRVPQDEDPVLAAD